MPEITTQTYHTEIDELKEYVKQAYDSTAKKISNQIYRGHLRSISTDIEDGIALFVSKLLPKHKILLDTSIKVENKTHRPDIIVVNEKDEVVAAIEIKANMGWCRDASKVVDHIIDCDNIFKHTKTLTCTLSNQASHTVSYPSNVKQFLIALTQGNCSHNKHTENKKYAISKNVGYFNLFDGWYNNLIDLEIETFIKELLK